MAVATKKLANTVTTVFNGSGFLGVNLIPRLGKMGSKIVVGHRSARYDSEKMRVCGGPAQIQFSAYNLYDENSLAEAMKYSDVVVNTIGKEHETRNFTFNEVHCEGPRRMARLARELGVKKFIHISALNASPDPKPVVLKKGSQFLRSKYHGELAVREEFPDAIIFRPSDIVGVQDNFINHYTGFSRTRLTHKLAIWDYYDGVEKQPVFVRDLVSGIVNAILDDRANGKTFQAVGPYRYDFYELIEFIRACGGQGQKYDECRITNMRYDLGIRLFLAFSERFKKYPFLTWERVERDSISDYIDPSLPTLEDLGVELTDLEIWLRTLANYRPREHRVEIPYESALQIDAPRKLNVATN